VNEVDKQVVLQWALGAVRRPEHRPQLQRPRQRRLTVVEVAGDDGRRPLDAMLMPRYRGDLGNPFGISDSQAARELPWGKLSRRMRYIICLFRISVSKVVPAICLECLISSFFHEKRKPLSGTILRW
jgi:hypothetical protein